MKNNKVQLLVKVAMMGAIASILMLFEFTLPFVPPFYELDFSEVVVLLTGFALGPWAAIMCEALKIILNLLFNGTTTMFVGEFANFVIGCAYVLPASILYHKHKDRKHAIKGMILGTIILTISCAFINYYIMLPAYSFFMGLPIDTFVAMGNEVNSAISSLTGLILFAVVPFNLLKGIVTSILVFFAYKRVSPILKKSYNSK